MQKQLPATITTLDILKTLAVTTMVIDHIGYYFLPDELWLRVIGRIGVPLWFFLIGYARTREIPPTLWVGALILLAVNPVVGMAIFPMNALCTIIIVRLVLDRCAGALFRNYETFLIGLLILALLIPPTAIFTEYGSMWLIGALFGYAVRNRPDLGLGPRGAAFVPAALCLFSTAAFAVSQQMNFQFDPPLCAAMVGGSALVFWGLMRVRVAELPRFTDMLPGWGRAGLRLGGRRTLEIYVAHLVVFKLVAACVDPDYFIWWNASLFG